MCLRPNSSRVDDQCQASSKNNTAVVSDLTFRKRQCQHGPAQTLRSVTRLNARAEARSPIAPQLNSRTTHDDFAYLRFTFYDLL